MIPRLSFNHSSTPSMHPYGENMVTRESSMNLSISRLKILVHAEIIPVTCHTKFHSSFSRKGQDPCPSLSPFPQVLHWREKSTLKDSQRNKGKATSVEASHGPDTPTHLLVNRPVSGCCSAIDRDIQVTETTLCLNVLGAIGAGTGIRSHAFVDKFLILFPVLCSSPATAGNLISKDRSSWS